MLIYNRASLLYVHLDNLVLNPLCKTNLLNLKIDGDESHRVRSQRLGGGLAVWIIHMQICWKPRTHVLPTRRVRWTLNRMQFFPFCAYCRRTSGALRTAKMVSWYLYISTYLYMYIYIYIHVYIYIGMHDCHDIGMHDCILSPGPHTLPMPMPLPY